MTNDAEAAPAEGSLGPQDAAGPRDPDAVPIKVDPAAVAANAAQIAKTLSGPLPPNPTRPIPRWISLLAAVGLILFIPWIIYLGFTLPSRASADDYDIAWLGFDIAMWAVMVALAYCLVRRKQATSVFAAVTATMLLVDAWFDVVTASGRDEYLLAVVQAAVLEVPLAVVCTWVSVNVERVRSQSFQRLRRRLQNAAAVAGSRQARTEPPSSPLAG